MAEYEDNPFADPFGDQSVTNATNNHQQPNLEEYNPFADNAKAEKSGDLSQPAIMSTTDTPPAYTPSPAAQAITNAPPVQNVPGHEELLRRQEELERKAEELQKREQQLASGNYNPRVNNWPPMPSWFPVGPCFFQDFEIEIPIEFRDTVKRIYYLWMAYVLALFLNLVSCLILFCMDTQKYGQNFGLSILWFCLYTPCSICWYRPVYNAFRNDSSMYFFLFFFIFFFQFCFGILMAIGIPNWGYAGLMLAVTVVGTNPAGGGICFVMGGIFVVLAVADLFFLKKVHSIYRSSGASFDKAQQEFATGFMKNPNVQSAAATAATAAVSSNYK